MKRGKYVFECVFKGDHIWFPRYIHHSPPSHGFHRRGFIFKQAFPDKSSSMCSSEMWDEMEQDRVLFTYDEELKILTKVEDK